MRPRTNKTSKPSIVPGPGRYDSYSELGAALSYGIGSTRKGLEFKIEDVPGPGMYNGQLSKSSPDWGFPKDSRIIAVKESPDVVGGFNYTLPTGLPSVMKS